MRVFRKLYPVDSWRLRDHLLRLDRADRRRRFFAGVSDAGIVEHCRRIDWLRSVFIGSFEEGELRGVAQLALEGGKFPFQAELALSVEGPWQNQGVGTALMRRAIVAASNRAVSSLYLLCLAENRRIQNVARKFHARLGFSDGEADAQIDVPLPTQLSMAEEAVDVGVALIAGFIDAVRPSWPWAGSPHSRS